MFEGVVKMRRSRRPAVVNVDEYDQALHEMHGKLQYALDTVIRLRQRPAVALPAKRVLSALLRNLAAVEARLDRLNERVQRRRAVPLTEEERRMRRIERAKELLRREAGLHIPD